MDESEKVIKPSLYLKFDYRVHFGTIKLSKYTFFTYRTIFLYQFGAIYHFRGKVTRKTCYFIYSQHNYIFSIIIQSLMWFQIRINQLSSMRAQTNPKMENPA